MEQIRAADQLINDIIAVYGTELVMDKEKMDIELKKDSEAYQGLGIKILSIAGGFLGSSFFFAFIVMMFHDASIMLMIFGLVAIVLSIWIDKNAENIALDAACLGGYLAGFGMVGYGVSTFNNENLTTFMLLLVALVTIVSTRAYVLNLFAIIAVNSCLYAFGNINDIPYFIHILLAINAVGFTLFSLKEAELLADGFDSNVRYAPVHAGFLVSLLGILIDLCFNISKSNGSNWVSASIIILLILYFVYQLLVSLQLKDKQILIYILSMIILLPMIYAPAICGAILILLIGFHTGRRFVLSIGVLAMLYFVGQFYYDLDYSLLVKSAMMFGTGVLFLSARFILIKQLKRYEQN